MRESLTGDKSNSGGKCSRKEDKNPYPYKGIDGTEIKAKNGAFFFQQKEKMKNQQRLVSSTSEKKRAIWKSNVVERDRKKKLRSDERRSE